ncbi:MAG: aminotransferase class I/II-fold pyridoxal phosphate-dependent enzyme [Kiritimatiellae bacterium]|nr:aminotransferase class I/II-fold pyridoxal phosphate-dependent enzyme [Kiritimatiellia bacterium]
MIRTLTVFYLHQPSRFDSKRLPVIEYGLTDAFRDFCRETFDARGALDYPPLKLIVANEAAQLAKALFTSDGPRGVLTEHGRACCLFLIDDDLLASTLEGAPLRDWLKRFFPAIPKVVLTRPGHPEVTLPARRWAKKDARVFAQPTKHHERLVHLFKSFWMPRFSTALRQYVMVKAGTNWHTPGHNGGRAFANSPFLRGFFEAFGSTIFRTDLSVSVESLGDLSSPEGRTPLSEAQKLTSEIFGTSQSRYVTNGTSTSNKAMLMTLLRPGETVLVDRNCHKSVHHAIVTSGAVPRYLPARWNAALGVWGPVSLEDIRRALKRQDDNPRLLILTTCTYEGILYPVWEIARACERAGVLFYADEAWAAYLNFHPFYTFGRGKGDAVRYSAVNEICGAHFSVQSTHKTLAAFSQASMIHVSTRFKQLLEEDTAPAFRWLRKRFALHGHGSYEKFSHDLHEFLRYWHSTSPHYPFLAALDVAGVQMRLEGMKLIDERIRWSVAFRKRVAEECGKEENACFAGLDEIAGPGIDWRAAGYMKDPLKIVLMLRSAKACETFRKALLKAHIQWEKASATTILFLVTAGTAEEHFEYLFRVCRQYRSLIGAPKATGTAKPVIEAVSGQAEVLPHDAALCDGELVTLEESVGRIASQFLVPYPPGVPVFLPGLRITKAMVQLVKGVIATDGVDAVHGLFCRGGHAPYLVEVLNRDEEARARKPQPLLSSN